VSSAGREGRQVREEWVGMRTNRLLLDSSGNDSHLPEPMHEMMSASVELYKGEREGTRESEEGRTAISFSSSLSPFLHSFERGLTDLGSKGIHPLR